MTNLATKRLLFISMLITAPAAAFSFSSVYGEDQSTPLYHTTMEAGEDSSLIGVYGEIPGRDLFRTPCGGCTARSG